MKRVLFALIFGLLFSVAASADTLHLKDGSTISGVIVGFDQNSFKVKTLYGYAIVRRDAVTSIDMAAGDSTADKKAAAEKKAAAATPEREPAKPSVAPPPATTATSSPKPEPPSVSGPASAAAARSNSSAATPPPAPAVSAQPVAPNASATKPAATPPAPASAPKGASAAKSTATAAPVAAPPKPSVEEPVRESVSGNMYENLTYGFRMYKPPTWNIIAGALKTLPGAITALGTNDETTYLLIGTGSPAGSLDADLRVSDGKLQEMFEHYRPLGDTHTTIAGLPAIERRFRGSVDERDWSGVVVTLERNKKAYTILGMTYASSDLVQIQENVIHRAITSLQFNQ